MSGAAMLIELRGPVRHDGDDYAEGDQVEMQEQSALALIAAGVAVPVEPVESEKPKRGKRVQ